MLPYCFIYPAYGTRLVEKFLKPGQVWVKYECIYGCVHPRILLIDDLSVKPSRRIPKRSE
jgi:hypothetical protein